MRRNWMYLTAVLGAAVVLTVNSWAPAYAYLCSIPENIEERMDISDGVFLGTATKVEELSVPEVERQFRYATTWYRTTFDVERVWKGIRSEELTVESELGFPVGGRWVIYAGFTRDDQDSDYSTSIWCSGNARIPDVTETNDFETWVPAWEPAPDEHDQVRVLYGNGHAPDAPPLVAQGLVGATAAGLAGFGVFALVRWIRQKVSWQGGNP